MALVKIHTLLWGGDTDTLTGLSEQLKAGYDSAKEQFIGNNNISLPAPEYLPHDEENPEEWFENKMNAICGEEDVNKIIILGGENMVSLCSEYLYGQKTEVLEEIHSKRIVFAYVGIHSNPLDTKIPKNDDSSEAAKKKYLLSKLVFLFWAPRTIDTVHLVAWLMVKKQTLRRIIVLHDETDYAINATKYFISHCYLLNVEYKSYKVPVPKMVEKRVCDYLKEDKKDKTGIYIIGIGPVFFEKVEELLNKWDYNKDNVWVSDCVVYADCFARKDSVFRKFSYIDCHVTDRLTARPISLFSYNIFRAFDQKNASWIIRDLYRFINNLFEKNNFFRDNDSAGGLDPKPLHECVADTLSKEHYFIDKDGNALYVAPHGIPMYPMSVYRGGLLCGTMQLPEKAEMNIDKVTYALQLVNAYVADLKTTRIIVNENRRSSDMVFDDIVKRIYKIGDKLKNHFELSDLQFVSSNDILNEKFIGFRKENGDNLSVTSILNACCSFSSSLQINRDEDDYEDNGAGRFFVKIRFRNGKTSFHPLRFALEKTEKEWNRRIYVSTSLDELAYDELYSPDKIHVIPPNQANSVFESIRSIFANQDNAHYCYIFPTVHTDPRSWFGGLVLFTREKLPFLSLQLLSDVAHRLFDPLFSAIHDYQLNFASTRSAIGSIMSRNGSHNIGSHVLSAMSHNVGTMSDDRMLYQYIQHRMDYVAQVTTEFPSWAQPTMFVGDIMRGFLSQHHLLEHISQSEGLQAYHFQDHNMDADKRRNQKSRIKLIIRRTFPQWDPKKEDTRKVEYSFIDDDKPIQLDKDVALAIPGGVVGKHAFYTILENIIRNAAKHGWSAASSRRESDNLEIYIDFFDDPNKDDIRFTIWDNMSDVFLVWKKNPPCTSDRENNGKAFCWDHSKIIPVVAHAFIQHPSALRLLLMTKSGDGNRKRKKHAENELEDMKKYLPALLRHECDYLKACIKTARQEKISPENSGKDESAELDRIASECISLLEIGSGDSPVQNQDEVRDEQNMDSALDTLIHKDYIYPLSSPRIKYFRDLMEDNRAFAGTDSSNISLINYFEELAEAFKDRSKEQETDSRKRAGHELVLPVLPLHWKQLLSLATPLIDSKTGTLRRENWGLAEMKISAGFLLRRTIDEIGGLDESCNYYGNAFLYPTACPDDCNCYHLGYRFAVPKPREILIIVSNKEQDEIEFSEEKKARYNTLHQYGIYIKSIADAKRNAERDPRFFAYEFVVFPSLECAIELVPDSVVPKSLKDDHERIRFANYPFRLLINDENGVSNLPDIFSRIKLSSDLLSNPDPDHPDLIVKEIQRIVLNGWRKHWIDLRYGCEGQPLELIVKPYESDSDTTGEGLITDADLFTWIFQENFHSSVKSFLSQNRDLPEDHRVALAALSSMKRHDIMQPNEFNELGAPGNRHEIWVIAQLRKWIEDFCTQYNQLKEKENGTSPCSNIIDPAQWNDCCPAKECPLPDDLFNAVKNYKEMLNKRSPESTKNPGVKGMLQPRLKPKQESLNVFFARFLDHLDGVFSQEEQRKAEKPITLPQGFESFSAEGKGELTRVITTNEGGSKWAGACQAIYYTRHFNRERNHDFIEQSAYNESLSGSQTYLYELTDLVKNATGGNQSSKSIKDFIKEELTITKLVENALSRILIIDERVCDFFQTHPKIQPAFSAMNIWVCNTAIDTPPHAGDDGYYLHTAPKAERTGRILLTPEFQSSNSMTTGYENKFDILIIHQGLIDKWLPANKKNEDGIRIFIESLKNVIPYVVLTTGRGRPANTPDEVRVIPYSVVASSLLKQYPEKMILVNSIMNILPVGKKQ